MARGSNSLALWNVRRVQSPGRSSCCRRSPSSTEQACSDPSMGGFAWGLIRCLPGGQSLAPALPSMGSAAFERRPQTARRREMRMPRGQASAGSLRASRVKGGVAREQRCCCDGCSDPRLIRFRCGRPGLFADPLRPTHDVRHDPAAGYFRGNDFQSLIQMIQINLHER